MKNRRVAGIFWAFLFASFAFSQSKTTDALSGAITHPSDSAVPGAKVTATKSDTGAKAEATSDDRGNVASQWGRARMKGQPHEGI